MNQLKKIYCLTPLYNDWESFNVLVEHIHDLQKTTLKEYDFSIVVVNDGSNEERKINIDKLNIDIKILNLKINIGHQRAIAVGLQYIYNELDDTSFVVVLDGDGEDKPEDIYYLLDAVNKNNSKKIIFAQRKKRQESVFFKIGYFFYKRIFMFLTGQKISFGNFSIIPISLLGKVVHLESIWNHFSGGIIQSKIPYDKILIDRGKRYNGQSKMNFNHLVLHGLSSISVYFDFLSIKILKYSLYGIIGCIVSVSYILFKKIFTTSAIPGWASSLTLIIAGIILQLFSVTLIVLLLQLSYRKNVTTPSSKKYLDFIEDAENV